MGLQKRTLIAAAVAAALVGAPSLPQLASLVAKFSADSITPQTDNTGLAAWNDSVNGISASQATGANQPKYRTSGLNGKPCVEFGGSAWLSLPASNAARTALDSQEYTLVVVTDQVLATSFGCMFGATNVAGGHMHVANATRVGRYEGNLTNFAVPHSANGFTVYGATCTKTYSAQVANVQRYYLQGGCYASFPSAVSTTGGIPAIGARDSSGTFPYKGRIHEVLIWSKTLTPAELMQVQVVLCAKYNQATPWSTVNRTLTIAGNSLSAAVGVSDVVDGYPYKLAQAAGLSYGQWTMCAIGGIQLNTMLAKTGDYSGIPSVTGKGHVVPMFEWANDKNAFSAAVCWDHVASYAALLNAAPNTRLILGSSLGYNGDPNTARVDFNNLCDANAPAICNAYVALHNSTLIGTQTAYATNSATYWNADGLHFIAAGQTALKDLMLSAVSAQLAA
jgi:hypothetical protein